jgi:EAL domain-containing protein (putative c-di-GMP-specific phosphodiesterase class I)/ActR/RegA family two-component response regulator
MSEASSALPLVVVVDDDASVRRSLARLLRGGGLATEAFGSGEALLEALDALEPRCAVIDVQLPGMDGLDLQRALRARRPDLPVLLITAHEAPEIRRRGLAAGALGFLLKPFSRGDLLDPVLAAVGGAAGAAAPPAPDRLGSAAAATAPQGSGGGSRREERAGKPAPEPPQSLAALTDEVRAALDHGDLFVAYLPIFKLADGACVGGEALVRWRRGGGVLPAGEFMPRIELTPLAGRITYWVMETVAAELGDWLDANPGAEVGINVPPEALGRGGIEHTAVRSGLRERLGQVVFEITERGVPDRLGLDALRQAAERGVRVALDDVSLTGVNLALLARCNFSAIKLDRRAVAQLQPDRPQAEWLPALQALLKTSPLKVVAEGVETAYQVKWLHAAGVQMAQGHYFSPPLPAAGLKELYAAQRGG